MHGETIRFIVKFTFKKGQLMTFHTGVSNSWCRRVEEKVNTVGV